ncbi:hypothetical protein BDV38DRAFT_253015 [Aspergillus pseudotamarii]|uniref:Uncharacterized protein n=1 Tax=Aspergillus pseudotamarii TaxID=132259 RepID=A0A5N6SMN0_ASPPS|nr:uncharacterized protein BDV38DRAFT_253015 [Aspergillus pseudotamarii]KAE8135147.1 hypothetical protein BDV38DRAFT_253015 [Aspergillus pseudotamarii]
MYVRVWMFPVASIPWYSYPVQRIDRPPQKPGNEDEFKGQLSWPELTPSLSAPFPKFPPSCRLHFCAEPASSVANKNVCHRRGTAFFDLEFDIAPFFLFACLAWPDSSQLDSGSHNEIPQHGIGISGLHTYYDIFDELWILRSLQGGKAIK